MEIPLLKDIVIIMGLSIPIILVFRRFRLPSILGFLITGVFAGPHGLNLVKAVHEVELLSEIGVIFLLFVIGIEFSLKGMLSIRKAVLGGGMMQVGGTIVVVAAASYLLGLTLAEAVFMGFMLSLSSTAIVLKMLQENGELTAPNGQVSVAILIFQDVIVVVMMLLTPLLAGAMERPGLSLLFLVVQVALILLVVYLMGKYIVPVVLDMVVRTKSQELFILSIVVLCFATAWFTSAAGLSLALGAFFAGLIISESEYSHQANANILPFREIFISFFFVSVGMLLDISFFLDHIWSILLLALGVMLLKLIVVAMAVYLLGYPLRTTLLSALALFQVGEFAFVLSTTGISYGLLSESSYQYFLAISVISMGITPFAVQYSPNIANALVGLPLPETVRSRLISFSSYRSEDLKLEDAALRDHLVIIGYGINGQNVARAAQRAQIPFVVVELDPLVISEAKQQGVPVVYGDATNSSILSHVRVQKARVVVIAISAPEATRQIVRSIRAFSETAYVVVRTRYLREVEEIIRMGADEVIPEEFETSIEIFTRVLKKYLVPRREVRHFINDIRSRNYELLTRAAGMEMEPDETRLSVPDMDIATIRVRQPRNKVVGRSIGEAGLRSTYGVTVLAIRRGDEYITDILPETEILQHDVVFLFGRPDDLQNMSDMMTYA